MDVQRDVRGDGHPSPHPWDPPRDTPPRDPSPTRGTPSPPPPTHPPPRGRGHPARVHEPGTRVCKGTVVSRERRACARLGPAFCTPAWGFARLVRVQIARLGGEGLTPRACNSHARGDRVGARRRRARPARARGLFLHGSHARRSRARERAVCATVVHVRRLHTRAGVRGWRACTEAGVRGGACAACACVTLARACTRVGVFPCGRTRAFPATRTRACSR